MTVERRPAIWSPDALADLDAIWDHNTRVAGRDAADKRVRGIGEVIATIETYRKEKLHSKEKGQTPISMYVISLDLGPHPWRCLRAASW